MYFGRETVALDQGVSQSVSHGNQSCSHENWEGFISFYHHLINILFEGSISTFYPFSFFGGGGGVAKRIL